MNFETAQRALDAKEFAIYDGIRNIEDEQLISQLENSLGWERLSVELDKYIKSLDKLIHDPSTPEVKRLYLMGQHNVAMAIFNRPDRARQAIEVHNKVERFKEAPPTE